MEKCQSKELQNVAGICNAVDHHQAKVLRNLTRLELKEVVINSLVSTQFTYLRNLGSGSYGDIVVMSRTGANKELAVKIVKTDKSSDGEVYSWPRLHHNHVQELEEIIYVEEYKMLAFIMPLQETNLFCKVLDKQFMAKKYALDVMKTWFVDILKGLSYLHSHGLCHLDLKMDNVLIAHNGRAVVCDFSYLDGIKIPAESYGIPDHCCPPEACPRFDSLGNRVPVFGVAADIWCFGAIVIDCLTKLTFTWKLPREPEKFSRDIYPALFGVLKKHYFKLCVESAMTSVKFKKKAIKLMKNFTMMFLRLDPDARPSAEKALTHRFLGQGTYTSPKDILWEKEVKSSEIDAFVAKYHLSLPKREFRNAGYKNLEVSSYDAPLNFISCDNKTALQCQQTAKQGMESLHRSSETLLSTKTNEVKEVETVAALNDIRVNSVTVSGNLKNEKLYYNVDLPASKEQPLVASRTFKTCLHHSLPLLMQSLQNYAQDFKREYKSMINIPVKMSTVSSRLKLNTIPEAAKPILEITPKEGFFDDAKCHSSRLRFSEDPFCTAALYSVEKDSSLNINDISSKDKEVIFAGDALVEGEPVVLTASASEDDDQSNVKSDILRNDVSKNVGATVKNERVNNRGRFRGMLRWIRKRSCGILLCGRNTSAAFD